MEKSKIIGTGSVNEGRRFFLTETGKVEHRENFGKSDLLTVLGEIPGFVAVEDDNNEIIFVENTNIIYEDKDKVGVGS